MKSSGNAAKGKGKARARKRMKSPLTAKELSEFRSLLLEKRRSLIGDLSGIQAGALGRNLQESSGDLSNMPTHPADVGSDNYEHEFSLGLLESERLLLAEINEALDRIERGTFGICLGTGDPIAKSRLRARPWCKYGIEYQRLIEKGLVRPGDEDRQQDEEDDEDLLDEDDDEGAGAASSSDDSDGDDSSEDMDFEE